MIQATYSFTFTVVTDMLTSLFGVVCFVGYALLSLYLGNGLITLPYNLVYKWWQRPKKLTSAEMQVERSKMQRKLRKMIDEAKDLRSLLSSTQTREKISLLKHEAGSQEFGETLDTTARKHNSRKR